MEKTIADFRAQKDSLMLEFLGLAQSGQDEILEFLPKLLDCAVGLIEHPESGMQDYTNGLGLISRVIDIAKLKDNKSKAPEILAKAESLQKEYKRTEILDLYIRGKTANELRRDVNGALKNIANYSQKERIMHTEFALVIADDLINSKNSTAEDIENGFELANAVVGINNNTITKSVVAVMLARVLERKLELKAGLKIKIASTVMAFSEFQAEMELFNNALQVKPEGLEQEQWNKMVFDAAKWALLNNIFDYNAGCKWDSLRQAWDQLGDAKSGTFADVAFSILEQTQDPATIRRASGIICEEADTSNIVDRFAIKLKENAAGNPAKLQALKDIYEAQIANTADKAVTATLKNAAGNPAKLQALKDIYEAQIANTADKAVTATLKVALAQIHTPSTNHKELWKNAKNTGAIKKIAEVAELIFATNNDDKIREEIKEYFSDRIKSDIPLEEKFELTKGIISAIGAWNFSPYNLHYLFDATKKQDLAESEQKALVTELLEFIAANDYGHRNDALNLLLKLNEPDDRFADKLAAARAQAARSKAARSA